MPIVSQQQKAAKQAAMKAAQQAKRHPPKQPKPKLDVDDVISSDGTSMMPEVIPPPLRQNGKFTKGCSGNPFGRPKQTLAALMRHISNKRRIPQWLGEVASGHGKYANTDLNIRIKAAQLIFAYAYGRPDTYDGDPPGTESVQLIVKRVVGVSDNSV